MLVENKRIFPTAVVEFVDASKLESDSVDAACLCDDDPVDPES